MAIPVSLQDAARQLRLTSAEAQDPERAAQLTSWIADAAAWVEKYTGQKLVAEDVTETFGSFDRLQLSAWPVKPDAAVAVEFEDRAGAAIALTGSRVSIAQRPATILPAAGTVWPPVGAGTVSVTLRAGYEPGDVVPGNFRRAMLVLIAAYDSDREGGDLFKAAEASAKSLCRDFRLRRL